jgi:hypothetical protein
MRIYMKIAFAVGLICLILYPAGASGYAFGTKVLPNDNDIGKPLFAMPAGTTIAYWDTGAPGYDDMDVVYLHTPGATVNPNDIRLTAFGNTHAPGSKVTPQDNDIGVPAILIVPASIVYLDLFGSANYDLLDPVYMHRTLAFLTIVNDVRLNITPGFGLMPGTKVRDFEPDLNKVIGGVPVALPLPPGSNIGFFDVNGNGAYDYFDDVYMNFPAGIPKGTVVVNNVRLSGPV